MLQLILADFCNFDTQKVSPTIHNSILAIINRYLILYRDAFLNYLQTLPLSLLAFMDIYFQNMQFITSRTAAYVLFYLEKSMPLLFLPFLITLNNW